MYLNNIRKMKGRRFKRGNERDCVWIFTTI